MLVRFKAIHRNTNFPMHVLTAQPHADGTHSVGFGKYAPQNVLRVPAHDGEAVMDFLVNRFGDKWQFEVIDDASGKSYGELLEDAEAVSLDEEDAATP